jgi:hypothetical protein
VEGVSGWRGGGVGCVSEWVVQVAGGARVQVVCGTVWCVTGYDAYDI